MIQYVTQHPRTIEKQINKKIKTKVTIAMRFITFCTLLTFLTVPAAYSGEVEVLHYWTSGGEAASVAVLKESMAKDGHLWLPYKAEC